MIEEKTNHCGLYHLILRMKIIDIKTRKLLRISREKLSNLQTLKLSSEFLQLSVPSNDKISSGMREPH